MKALDKYKSRSSLIHDQVKETDFSLKLEKIESLIESEKELESTIRSIT